MPRPTREAPDGGFIPKAQPSIVDAKKGFSAKKFANAVVEPLERVCCERRFRKAARGNFRHFAGKTSNLVEN